MPRPYLHHVHSQPTKVSEATWKQWYSEEHIRDMVYFKVSRTSAFYAASSDTYTYLQPPGRGIDQKQYLALYQMGRPRPWDQKEYKENVRLESQLWDRGLSCLDIADLCPEDLELVEILGSYEYNESMLTLRILSSNGPLMLTAFKDVAPYILHARISGEEVESKLQFEHVNAVSKCDGYRRSMLFRPLDRKDDEPYVIMLHEFESAPTDLGLVKEEMEAIGPSKDCSFQLRSFELLNSEGFGGECRRPERL